MQVRIATTASHNLFAVGIAATMLLTGLLAGCGTASTGTPTSTSAADGYDYRRRVNERVYEAPVTSVRAVMGNTEQRCWVERERVSSNGTGATVGGAIAGAVVGGILGHQVGSGRGQDAATVGGAVAGGAAGAKIAGRDRYQDVRHCETVASETPQYWDVTYKFNGTTHYVQMTNPPGRTVTVNSEGEPRV